MAKYIYVYEYIVGNSYGCFNEAPNGEASDRCMSPHGGFVIMDEAIRWARKEGHIPWAYHKDHEGDTHFGVVDYF
ncbi:unnamed protein product [marine sediment metagenome]|uniref:Uncharacterized protein n=1 Tax=marine sediment metagenome TaxID=412755 RepID=X0VGM3_9ZZZZ